MGNVKTEENVDNIRVTFQEPQPPHMLYKMVDGGYKCDFCDNVYTSKWNMIRHRRKHTGERKYICRICGKAFHRGDYLSEHEKNTHKIVFIKKNM